MEEPIHGNWNYRIFGLRINFCLCAYFPPEEKKIHWCLTPAIPSSGEDAENIYFRVHGKFIAVTLVQVVLLIWPQLRVALEIVSRELGTSVTNNWVKFQ